MVESQQQVDLDEIQAAAERAVEQGAAIQQQVRDITLRALSQGQLDTQQIRSVVQAVMEGVSHGAERQGVQVREALSQSLAGLDEALLKSAEASKLAIQEAAGRVEEFTLQDMKRALDDLLALEGLFFETVGHVAQESGRLVREVLEELLTHAQNSGTGVGERVAEAVEPLRTLLEQTSRNALAIGAGTVRTVSGQIARVASGILAGFADALQEGRKGESTSTEKGPG